MAQNVAEALDELHRLRLVVLADEDGDGVERVEQEMRVELHAEGAELRLRELGPELLELADAPAVLRRVADTKGAA